MPPPDSASPIRSSRARRVGLAVALWVFGLSTTVLLVGMWGRSVTTDQQAIESGTRAVLESEAVTARITSWIADGIESGAGELPTGVAANIAAAVWSHPDTRTVLADAVDLLVDAALAEPGAAVPIDLAEVLRPLASVVVGELDARGISLTPSVVESAFAEMPTVVLSTDAESAVASAVTEARATLTRVVALALVGMLLGAGTAVALTEDRMRQLRGLAVRVVVSALSFAILLRLGSWALDPGGGRSPLAAGGAVILASSGHVLVIAALVAAGIAIFATMGVKRRRRAAA